MQELKSDSYITHDKFVSVNNMFREYEIMKEAVKNLKSVLIYLEFPSTYKKMLSYCLKCRKNIEQKLMLLSKCALFDSKELKFSKEQERSGLLSNLGIRTPSNKILLLGNILF